MNTPASAAPPAAITPAQRRVYAFLTFPNHRSRGWLRDLLSRHYPRLWEEIRVKWLPTAREISSQHLTDPARPDGLDYVRGYSREVLADMLVSLGEAGIEWDGYEVGSRLEQHHGWRTDFHLCALIHAWSTGVVRSLRQP
jgi:hypothetical protein